MIRINGNITSIVVLNREAGKGTWLAGLSNILMLWSTETLDPFNTKFNPSTNWRAKQIEWRGNKDTSNDCVVMIKHMTRYVWFDLVWCLTFYIFTVFRLEPCKSWPYYRRGKVLSPLLPIMDNCDWWLNKQCNFLNRDRWHNCSTEKRSQSIQSRNSKPHNFYWFSKICLS